MLECTTGAARNHVLQRALHEFAEVMDFQYHQLEFNLSKQWPCQRFRWWAVLFPKDWPSLQLRDWDLAFEHQQTLQVMPVWPAWRDVDVASLILSPFEILLYFEDFPEKDGRLIRSNGPLPCFLHSYGNATGPCPCDCRAWGFKLERLRKSGLRGVLVRHLEGFRFLHPLEAAFFVGMPLDLDYGSRHKDTLCLLGQIASPIQALWVFAHIRGMLNLKWGVQYPCRPLREVHEYKMHLLFQKFHCLPSEISNQPHLVDIELPSGEMTALWVSPGMTVQDLCNAERINLLSGQCAQVFDGDLPLPNCAYLRDEGFFGSYKLRHLVTPGIRDAPSGLVCVSFTLQNWSSSALIPAGSFLFEVEDQLEFTLPQFMVDDRGDLWRPDDRVWYSIDLGVDPHGAGFGQPLGLSLDFVVMMLRTLTSSLATRPTWTFLHCMVMGDKGLHMVYHSSDHWHYALDFGPLQEHMICLLTSGHWIFVRGISSGDGGKLWLLDFDGLDQLHSGPSTQAFATALEDQVGIECLLAQPPRVLSQTLPNSCGTIMLLQLCNALGLVGWDLLPSLEHLHPVLCRVQAFLGGSLGCIGFGAEEVKATQQLMELLVEKGVPRDRAEERATLGLKKIGLFEIQQALANKSPWTYLKAVASRPHVAFQWLRADELQGKIRARATAKFQIQPSHKARKKDNRRPEQPLILDPTQLSLLPNTFFAQGKSLPQIPFSGLGMQAWGIAFGTVADLGPYLQAGNLISDKALGVLTTTVIPTDQVGTLHVDNIRFPALYKGTDEPLLVMGSLVILGKVAISRADTGALCSLQPIPTQTLRIAVFKDQWPGDWSDFIEHPLRSLLLKVPMLCLCKQTGCGVSCPKFHADIDEPLDQLLLDVWSRNFHRLDTKFAKPKESVLWTALVRVPKSAHLTLQTLSGKLGLYVEPRSDSGKEVDPNFGVIWLGNVSLQDAHHKQQTTDKALAVCRLNSKYGLRVHADDLEATHKLLKPDEQFSGNLVQEVYKIYPLPWGTQRAALQKCLNDWGWKAKVLQTVGGGAEGLGWEVGSNLAPPSNVLQFDGGDAAITHLRSANKDPKPVPILASATTKKHIKQGTAAASSDDPWGNYQDPWAQGRQVEASAQSASSDRLSQIEAKWTNNLRDAVRKEIQHAPQPMEDDTFKTETEERFARIESSLTEMQAQHVKYEGWFSQMHQTDQFLTGQIQEANHRMEGVKQTLEAQVSQLSSQVTSGFNNIEALLAKRAKTTE